MQSSYKDEKELCRKIDSANSIGSFWLSRIKPQGHVFSLIEAGYKARLFSQFSNAAEQLLSDNTIVVENIEMPVSSNDVLYTGSERFDSGQVLDTDGSYRESLDEGNVKLWLLEMPKLPIQSGLSINILYDIFPMKIISGGDELIYGLDFSFTNGYIEFFTEPAFVKSEVTSITIATGICLAKSFYRHPLGVDSINESSHVVRFARNSQSPRDFIAAVASIGKQQVTSYDQRLEEVHQTDEGVLYIFEKEILKVPYAHTLLESGKLYKRGEVIGEGVKGFHNDGTGKWWKDIDFRGGLAMAPITGDKLLLIPDRMVTAYVADVSDIYILGERKAHVRFEMDGDKDAEDAYWAGVKVREEKFKKFLDDIINIDRSSFSDEDLEDVFDSFKNDFEDINQKNKEQGRSKEFRNIKRLDTAKRFVNPVDVFFEGILGSKAFVIRLNAEMIPNIGDVVSFINKEHPSGCLPIIFLDQPAYEETFEVSNIITDSFEYSVLTESSTEENIGLAGVIEDEFTDS